MAGLGLEATISIVVQGIWWDVDVNHVHVGGDGIVAEYVMDQGMFQAAVDEFGIVNGDIIVFTKVGNNTLNLMAFDDDGNPKTEVQFMGASMLLLD